MTKTLRIGLFDDQDQLIGFGFADERATYLGLMLLDQDRRDQRLLMGCNKAKPTPALMGNLGANHQWNGATLNRLFMVQMDFLGGGPLLKQHITIG